MPTVTQSFWTTSSIFKIDKLRCALCGGTHNAIQDANDNNPAFLYHDHR